MYLPQGAEFGEFDDEIDRRTGWRRAGSQQPDHVRMLRLLQKLVLRQQIRQLGSARVLLESFHRDGRGTGHTTNIHGLGAQNATKLTLAQHLLDLQLRPREFPLRIRLKYPRGSIRDSLRASALALPVDRFNAIHSRDRLSLRPRTPRYIVFAELTLIKCPDGHTLLFARFHSPARSVFD